jgi:hypothetical protein
MGDMGGRMVFGYQEFLLESIMGLMIKNMCFLLRGHKFKSREE